MRRDNSACFSALGNPKAVFCCNKTNMQGAKHMTEPQEIYDLMASPAYLDGTHPQHNEAVKEVEKHFKDKYKHHDILTPEEVEFLNRGNGQTEQKARRFDRDYGRQGRQIPRHDQPTCISRCKKKWGQIGYR